MLSVKHSSVEWKQKIIDFLSYSITARELNTNLENLSSLWKLLYLMFHSIRVISKLPTLTRRAAPQVSAGALLKTLAVNFTYGQK